LELKLCFSEGLGIGFESSVVEHGALGKIFNDEGIPFLLFVFHSEIEPLVMLLGVGV
jgi:hypothetical protein